MRRWLRLLTYLGVVCATLYLGLGRLLPWASVLRGPASSVEGLVSPFAWLGLTAVAIGGLLWLVADLGFGMRRMPPAMSALVVGAAVVAVLLIGAEARTPESAWSRLSDAPAKVQAVRALGLLGTLLGDHHRSHGSYPTDPETLGAALREEDGSPILSAYLYAAARRRELEVRVLEGRGPVVRPPDGALPGTMLIVFSPAKEAYWLTAVVGEGRPATPRILASEEGSPVIVSNVPRGWTPP